MMFSRSGLLALVFALSFSLAGCDDDDYREIPGNGGEDLPDPGEFQATITGDIERDLKGTAFYEIMEDPASTEVFFFLNLAVTDSPGHSIWASKGGPRPASGSYSILNMDMEDINESWLFDHDRFAVWFIDDPAGNLSIFLADGGTMNIHRSHEDEVVGEFFVEATGFFLTDMNTPLKVEVRGAFNAKIGDVQPPDL